jgi:hypothetical protein
MRLLLSGESRRRVERTEWNLHSSRSHTIFSLTLESRPVNGPATFPITSSTMRQVTRQSSRTQLRSDLNPLDPPSVTSPSQPSPSTCEVFLGTGIGKMPITPSVTRFKSSTASSKSSGHVPDGSIRISQLVGLFHPLSLRSSHSQLFSPKPTNHGRVEFGGSCRFREAD